MLKLLQSLLRIPQIGKKIKFNENKQKFKKRSKKEEEDTWKLGLAEAGKNLVELVTYKITMPLN